MTDDGSKSEDKAIIDKIDLNNWNEILGWNYEFSPTTPYAVVYGRVSSDDQNPDACQSRVEDMLDKMLEDGILLERPPIIDQNYQGHDKNRPGLRQIIRAAPHIDYIYVYSLDRWAKRLPFGLYFLDELNRQYDIEVVTESRRHNLRNVESLILANIKSLTSEVEHRERARKSLHGVLTSFKNGNWLAVYKKIPLGYVEAPDLLKVVDEQVPIIREMIDEYVNEIPVEDGYMIGYLNEKYGDYFQREIQKEDITRRFLYSVYVGKPAASGQSIGDTGQKVERDRPDLRMLTDQEQESLREKVNALKEANSRDNSNRVLNTRNLISEFDLIPVKESSPKVKLCCSDCDTAPVLKPESSREVDSHENAVIYSCPDCGGYCTYPNRSQLKQIRLSKYVIDNLEDFSQDIDWSKMK